jgi:hypothetical protein
MPLHLSRLSIVLGLVCLCSTPALGQLGLLGRLRPVDYSNLSNTGATASSNDGLPTSPSRLRMTPPTPNSALGELSSAATPPTSGIDLAATAATPDSPLLQGLRDSSVFNGSPTGSALPGTTNSPVIRDGPVGDCAEPSRVNLDISLAEKADVVITGEKPGAAAVPGHRCLRARDCV